MDYEKECRQACPDLLKLFFIIEALVFFLDETYDSVWLSNNFPLDPPGYTILTMPKT